MEGEGEEFTASFASRSAAKSLSAVFSFLAVSDNENIETNEINVRTDRAVI